MTGYHLQIVTPDGLFFNGEAEYLVVRSINGEVGIRARHTDYVTALGMGEARLTVGGQVRRAACIGGMLSVNHGECTLVATTFEWAEDIDLYRAKASLERAEKRLSDPALSPEDRAVSEAKLRRAKVRVSVAQRNSGDRR